MRKFLSIFAALLVAVAVNASTDFAEPYYCSADDAVLANVYGLSLVSSAEPHYIQCAEATYNVVLATWTVSATRGCYISASLDMGPAYGSNKHIFEVTIKDSKGNTKGTLVEAAESTAADQVVDLVGTILIPVEGEYTVELISRRQYGKGTIKNIILTYAADAPSEIIAVSSVELDKTELALEVAEVEQLAATVLPDNATDPTVSWESSDKEIATVSEDGLVTAIAEGTATIKAKAGEKEATCAVTVAAVAIPDVNFAAPYVLSAKKAQLEGAIWKMYKDDTYKLYGDGGHNKQYGNALWTINVTKPCILSGVLNGVEGGHLFELDLYKGEEFVATIAHPEGKAWSAGEIDLEGTFTITEAGNYTFKLRNTQEWSSGKVAGITLTDVTPQRLYLKPNIWYWEGNQEKFAIYAWADGKGDVWSDFMELAENETAIWTGTIPAGYDNVIFVRFGNAAKTPSWSDNMWNQTNDLTLEEGKDLYTITLASWEGHEGPCPGEWSKYTHVENPKFYISGSLTGWASVASYADSYEFDLEAGCYSLKVITLKSKYLGYADLTEEYKAVELYPDEDGNVCFTLETAGKVTVTYIEDNVFKLEGDFVLPPVRLPGITDWKNYPTLTPAENKLTASATVTLAWNYGYSFKVICGNTWLGKAKNGVDNYEVTRDAATLNGLSWEGDDMILRADKAGEYTFTWTYATRELVVTYPDLVLEEGFYLVGTFDNEEEWDVASLNAGKKFAFNKEISEGNNEWKITVPLHTGDRFKAVYIYGDNIASWHPEGSGNDYVVDANHAGASKTIYFQEEYNAEWDGYFYIEQNWPTAIDNSDADIKVEKFFRDGQFIIRKNGVEYNAQGAIVK